MSGRGRNSKRRGLLTTMVNVRMTGAELARLDALRRHAHGHANLVIECRADVLRRLLAAAAVENISNQVIDPRQVTLDQAIERSRIRR